MPDLREIFPLLNSPNPPNNIDCLAKVSPFPYCFIWFSENPKFFNFVLDSDNCNLLFSFICSEINLYFSLPRSDNTGL